MHKRPRWQEHRDSHYHLYTNWPVLWWGWWHWGLFHPVRNRFQVRDQQSGPQPRPHRCAHKLITKSFVYRRYLKPTLRSRSVKSQKNYRNHKPTDALWKVQFRFPVEQRRRIIVVVSRPSDIVITRYYCIWIAYCVV